MTRMLITMLLGAVAMPALADDMIYAYCRVAQDRPAASAGSIILLSYNLNTAEEILFLKPPGNNAMQRLAGRNAHQDTGFTVSGNDPDLLYAARSLRDSVSRHAFHWTRVWSDSEPLQMDEAGDCSFSETASHLP